MSATEIEYIEADGEYMQLEQSDMMEADAVDDGDDHWGHKSIALLLSLYLQNIESFRNPKIKKKNVWTDISNAVGKGPGSCDKKFRNLKQTYIRLLRKKNREGASTIKWPYFNVFEEIYSINGEYQPEIQQKIHDSPSDTLTKALLTINKPKYAADVQENGECSSNTDDSQRRVNKKRYTDFKKVTLEMRDRQRTMEQKLDRLINIVEESNEIQRERNRLFIQFLDKLNPTT